MRILVACEVSGIVRDAFLKKGHDAWSCDIQETLTPGPHLCTDVKNVLNEHWDMMIAFPPCTYLCTSGARWFSDRSPFVQTDAVSFFLLLARADIPRICIENPVGIMSSLYRKPDQIIQPWHFGHDASKKTCLWLKNLPKLKHTKVIRKPAWIPCPDCDDYWCTLHQCHVYDCECPDVEVWAKRGVWPYESGGRYSNQTPAGNPRLGGSKQNSSRRKNRGMIKSMTYKGVAKAMAEQWGNL